MNRIRQVVLALLLLFLVSWQRSGGVESVCVADPAPIDAVEALAQDASRSGCDHLSAEMTRPSTRKVLWQVGRLDGKPDHAQKLFFGELSRGKVGDDSSGMDDGRRYEEFPQQRILPGQTIEMDIPGMKAQDLLFRAVVVSIDEPGATLDPTKAVPTLRILCNDYSIWSRRLSRQGFMISALIPASYLKPKSNCMTLQNIGKEAVVFDALWIESAVGESGSLQFTIRDWERIPEKYQEQFKWNRECKRGKQGPRIPSNHDLFLQYPIRTFEAALRRKENVSSRLDGLWHYSNSFVAFNEQEKVVLHFLEKSVGWYFHGGSALTIENVTGVGRFFCPYTGQQYPSAFALSTLSRVFEGNARRLPVNVMPGRGQERPLDLVYWLATENTSGVASIIIARSRYGNTPGGKVRVVCAVPWQGATVLHVNNGVFPEDVFMEKPTGRGGRRKYDDPYRPYDRDRINKDMHVELPPSGKGGLLDVELDIRDCLLIRLVQDGAEPIGLPPQREGTESQQVKNKSSVQVDATVSTSRENSTRLIKRFPVFEGSMSYLSPNYRVRIDNATKGVLAGLNEAVPEEGQSLFFDVDYTFGVPLTAEGAALNLHAFHERLAGRVLSFWVYPHIKTGGDPVPLRMGLGAWEGCVMLQPEKWQRVELCFANITGLTTRYLVLLAPASDDPSRRMHAITFEFNGIKLLDGPEDGS